MALPPSLLLFHTHCPSSLYLPLCYLLSHSDRHDMEVVRPTSVHWLVVGCAAEWLAHHSTSASGDRAISIVFLSAQSATVWILSSNGQQYEESDTLLKFDV